MKFIASIVLALTFFTGFAQVEEMKVSEMAATWESGKHAVYYVEGNISMKNGKREITFIKGESGIVDQIKIEGNSHPYKLLRYNDSEIGWELYYKDKFGGYLFLKDKSIVRFEWRNNKAFVREMFGDKYGSVKKAMKDIDAYAEAAGEAYSNAEADKDAARKALIANNTLEGHTVKKFEAEIISDDAKLDCGSEFKVGFTVTRDDGRIIKSITLGGDAIHHQYSIITKGVTKKKGTYDNTGTVYIIDKYCDKMIDKQVTVKVKVSGSDEYVKTFTLPTSCVPDPEVIAAKKLKEKKKKEAELLAIQKEKEAAERKKQDAIKAKEAEARRNMTAQDLANEQKKIAAKVKANATALKNGEVVGNGNRTGMVIFDSNVKLVESGERNGFTPSFSRNINGQIVAFGKTDEANGYVPMISFSSKGKTTYKTIKGEDNRVYDGDIDPAGNLCYITSVELSFAKNSAGSFAKSKTISAPTLFGKENAQITSVISLGSNKTMVTGTYEIVNNSTGERVYPNLMAVWDHETSKFVNFQFASENPEEYLNTSPAVPKLLKTNDGKAIVTYSKNDDAFVVKFDPMVSLKSGKVEEIWKQEIEGGRLEPFQIFEDSKKNIILSYQDDIYNGSAICCVKIDENGEKHVSNTFSEFNLNLWGCSDKYSIKQTTGESTISRKSNGSTIHLLELPNGDFLLSAKGFYDVRFPSAYSKVHNILTNYTSLFLIKGSDFSIQSFDFIQPQKNDASGASKIIEEYYECSALEYDASTKEIIMYLPELSSVLRVKPTYRTKWAPGADQSGSYTPDVASNNTKDPNKPNNNGGSTKKPATKTSTKVNITYTGKGLIKFGDDNNTWGSLVGHDQTEKLDCDEDIYIYRNVNGQYKRAEKVMSANTNCGGSIEVE